jgi:hypothetical protein
MLAQLETVKARLGLIDNTQDALLNAAIGAISARFDRECGRRFERAENLVQEFSAAQCEIGLLCYPVERVTRFELKDNETVGWVERFGVEYLVRRHCVVSLSAALGTIHQQARLTYHGGYVPPGTVPESGQTPLPAELEQAAMDQTVFWYQNRDRMGLSRVWDYHATYRQFADVDLLPGVRAVLAGYERWEL